MSKTCWIIYNGFLASEKFKDFALMLQEAAIHLGDEAYILRNDELMNKISSKNTSDREHLPDYVLFTDKDIYLAKQLEMNGIPVYNSSTTIEISDDKIKTYQALQMANISIPTTIVAPKTYGLPIQLSDSFVQNVIDCLGFPLIMKETFGSFGEQVYFIENEEQLLQRCKQIAGKPFMFQQFIETSYGVDTRLQVVGDAVVAAMKRSNEHDFRANVTNGGKMAPYKPSKEEVDIAIQATKAIGAQFAGVDLLYGENKQPIVCEVNSNAHIRNLLDCTGINVAPSIIKHVRELP